MSVDTKIAMFERYRARSSCATTRAYCLAQLNILYAYKDRLKQLFIAS